jgi:hypothetical protein
MRSFAAILAVALLAVTLPGVVRSASAPAVASAPAPAPANSGPALSVDLPLRRNGDADAVPAAYAAWTMVLVVALGGVFLLRQARAGKLPGFPANAASNGGELRVLSVRAIGSQVTLQVVEWNSKHLLLGCTPQAVTVLDMRPCDQPSKATGASQ